MYPAWEAQSFVVTVFYPPSGIFYAALLVVVTEIVKVKDGL